MSTPSGFGFGVRYLLDQQQAWQGSGLPVYLRIDNSDDSEEAFADVGFEIVVTSPYLLSGAGTQDLQILPQPEVTPLSLMDIGIMGGKLMFGARKFIISHTWVIGQMELMRYTNPLDVFRDPARVVGLWHDNQMWSIEQINHIDVGGVIIKWVLMCNSAQQNISDGTGTNG